MTPIAGEMVAPACKKCHGTGAWQYDRNHAQPCPACCAHNAGWWLLQEHYGAQNGLWCCQAGCGTVRADNPTQKDTP